ncbi:MAG: hypothetical protein ACRD3R_13270 [Terriglobales bacterium]
MKQDLGIESAWLGGEALPGGLAEINSTIQANAEAASRKRQFLLQERRSAGLIAIAGRWMKKATWFS